jgi:LysM repeat protein
MKNALFNTLFAVCLLAVTLPVSTSAHAQSTAQNTARLAGLESEFQAMRDEIQKLRTEVQDLHAALTREQARNNSNTNTSSIQQQLAADRVANAEALRALESRTNQRITKLGEAFNKELNKTLATPAVRPPAPQPSGTRPSNPIPSDIPRNAVKYTIKSGDTLEKIARLNKSKVAWILAVNDGLTANKLKVGREILVPRNADPDPESPPPAPPPPPAQ